MFCERLRSCRIYRGLTQREMALEIGIALRHYQKYESGEVEPPLERLVHLADFLNVSADFLLCRDEFLESAGVLVDIPKQAPHRERRTKSNS